MGAVALGSMAYGVSTILTGGAMLPAMLAIYGSMSTTIFLGNVVGKAPQSGSKLKDLSDKVIFKHNHFALNAFNVIAGSKAVPKAVIMGTGFLAARAFPMAALALLAASGISYVAGLNLGNMDRLQAQENAEEVADIEKAAAPSAYLHRASMFSSVRPSPRESKIFPQPR